MPREKVEFPMPGKLISVNVTAGSQIKEEDVICVLESMKMENPIVSPVSGKVVEINLTPGQVVGGGDLVAVIEY